MSTRRNWATALTAALFAAALGVCGVISASALTDGGPPAAGAAALATTTADPGGLSVLVEPQAGLGPIYKLIDGAHQSIELTMYELRDQTAETDLANAAARGVDVRVILDQHLERARNATAYNYLASHGVHVVWGPAATTYHQKTLTVDGATSVIMTLNLVSEDYPDTRDFAVVDTQPADVSAIVTTFDADFAHRAITPPDGVDLVWSPTNATASILNTINGARHTLSVENEEMSDSEVVDALESAARHGVDVQVIMTADSAYDQDFAELSRAGVHVRTYPDSYDALYIHAKAIVADSGLKDQRVLVGSENFSAASLDYNRELGLATTNPQVVSVIDRTLASDYAGATAYKAR